MSPNKVKEAVQLIQAERDAVLKLIKIASLVAALFRARGIELVVVGGSAIELYTEGAYMSGDVDLCILSSQVPVTARLRQEIMGSLGARGGPRNWEVLGTFVDVLGPFESLARTSLRDLEGPFGSVRLAQIEELIVERVLASTYPGDYPPARECAIKLIAAALQDEAQADWKEVRRLAEASAYANWPDVKELVNEQAKALKIRSPYDSDE